MQNAIAAFGTEQFYCLAMVLKANFDCAYRLLETIQRLSNAAI
jgi:hypothetical protein